MKTEDSSSVAVGCVTILLLPLFSVWRSYVGVKLWTWFIVSTFGLPALSMPAAYGVTLVAAMLFPQAQCEGQEKGLAHAIGRIVGYQVVWPAAALFLGWMVRPLL